MGLHSVSRTARAVFGVVGLGYVGLPLAVEMAQVRPPRHRHGRIRREGRRGQRGAQLHPRRADRGARRAGRRRALRGHHRLLPARECDAIVICVPTPLNEMKEPDISYMESAAPRASRRTCSAGMLVMLESTTYPGTTEEVVQPILETRRPEGRATDSSSRSRPSAWTRATRSTRPSNTPKVVGGVTPGCTQGGRRVLRALRRRRSSRSPRPAPPR